jgi:hypothetical protein
VSALQNASPQGVPWCWQEMSGQTPSFGPQMPQLGLQHFSSVPQKLSPQTSPCGSLQMMSGQTPLGSPQMPQDGLQQIWPDEQVLSPHGTPPGVQATWLHAEP